MYAIHKLSTHAVCWQDWALFSSSLLFLSIQDLIFSLLAADSENKILVNIEFIVLNFKAYFKIKQKICEDETKISNKHIKQNI